MDKNYVIKSITPKVWDWKVLWYSMNYHHKSYPDSIQSVFVGVNDMKTIYKCDNENQINALIWQSCYVEKKLVIN